MLLRKTLNTF